MNAVDAENSAGRTAAPTRGIIFYFSILAANIGVCCQPSDAVADTGTCPGIASGDGPGLAACIVNELCIEGIYSPPRSIDLPQEVVEAYRDAEIDIAVRHFRLDVRFRKRAGAEIGQCGYTGPTKFMYSLVQPASATNITVTFDPNWTY
ncbi:hypothetical protein T8K17_24145 [Thalassobaculum sp. OXR-137]|uniref:hypothetical protein n=1 Tax=Thalassobaculum sp. OXR-137 TaxID=3100173 RepID=UPI002AC9933D|nr:hypothetical protein [Thalassobaculum sp. OXR-137]WPZ34310.1 hypothetical protein T8K17_24145 [Thalassobaculum sp. OXR-137]